jgi:hypothetical protein
MQLNWCRLGEPDVALKRFARSAVQLVNLKKSSRASAWPHMVPLLVGSFTKY